MSDNARISIVVVAVATCVIAYLYFMTKPLGSTSHSEDIQTEVTINPDRPMDYYQDILFKIDDSFKDGPLKYICGNNPDDYTVNGDSKVQEEMDKSLWGYCLRTSDLYALICNYMKENNYHDQSAYNLLANILYRQNVYLEKYASDLMKKDALENTFKFEREQLESVANHTSYNQERLFNMIDDISKTK